MEMGGEGNGTKHDGCPNPFSSCRHGHVPTRCKLRLTVLQRYYTKNLIENADYLKRATGWHGNHLHIVGIVLVNKHPMGRPASRRPRASRHTQVPLLGFLLELLCLEFVFLLFVCMFLFRLFVWSTVQFGWSGAQSHISSGISWGLRIPGTDIWILCFSSWAWRSDASRSSRNRSVVSSPANSCNGGGEQGHVVVRCTLRPFPVGASQGPIMARWRQVDISQALMGT